MSYEQPDLDAVRAAIASGPCVCHGENRCASHEDLETKHVPALLAEVEELQKRLAEVSNIANIEYARAEKAEAAVAVLRVQRDDAREELATAQKKLHAVATTKVWTNEDGRRFVFASDLAAACLGTDGEATS